MLYEYNKLFTSISLWLVGGHGLMEGSPCLGEDELKDVLKTADIVDSYTISWDQKLGEGLSGFVR